MHITRLRIPHQLTTLMLLVALLPLPLIGCSKSSTEEPEQSAVAADNQANQSKPEPINLADPKYVKCWAQINNRTPNSGMTNAFDQLRGPAEFSDLSALSQEKLRHTDWNDIITHVSAGESARVTLYSEPGFKGESLVIEPGGKSRDLIAEPLGDGVSSITIEFVEQGG